MSSRSERYRAKAEKCQARAASARTPASKRLNEELARQWLVLAEQANGIDEPLRVANS